MEVHRRLESYRKRLRQEHAQSNASERDMMEKVKEEKIRIALEKIHEAHEQKSVVRVYTDDGTSKTLAATFDEVD
jgi:hypothetical protein